MTFTRRLFLRWSAFASAAIPLMRRALPAQGPSAPTAPKGLEAERLMPLAAVVLPQELGAARIERATREFTRWIGGYRAGEETVHPYGSERLGATGPAPFATWSEQLSA